MYVDDVVVFLRPQSHELHAIKELLSLFSKASGLRVNFVKTIVTLIREALGMRIW
jgi:hypothetical protein